jgi:hypothetical protein
MAEGEAVKLWEDAVGDSGQAPTDKELATFANAVLAANGYGKLEEAWDEGHQSGRNDEYCLDPNPYRRPE